MGSLEKSQNGVTFANKMAVSKSNKKKQSYISVPSQIINSISSTSLESLLLSPKKKAQSHVFSSKFRFLRKNPRFWLFLVSVFGFLGMLKVFFNHDPMVPFAPNPCSNFEDKAVVSKGLLSTQLIAVGTGEKMVENVEMGGGGDEGNADEKSEFWKQPNGLGYRPCLEFSREYKRTSVDVVKDRTKYLMVVVAGGLNQQRNQIVDAVVIARILGAALVVPILQVNVIWGDERFVLFESFLHFPAQFFFPFLLRFWTKLWEPNCF